MTDSHDELPDGLCPAEDVTHGSAVFSSCQTYRYQLTRIWGPKSKGSICLWVLLNPSTADGNQDDPTIRRLIQYSKNWGFHGLAVVNLFAYRTTDPTALVRSTLPEIIGPDNDQHIRTLLSSDLVGDVVCGWGATVQRLSETRDHEVVEMIYRSGHIPKHLGLNKDCTPKHPLYLKKDAQRTVLTSSEYWMAELLYAAYQKSVEQGGPGAQDKEDEILKILQGRRIQYLGCGKKPKDLVVSTLPGFWFLVNEESIFLPRRDLRGFTEDTKLYGLTERLIQGLTPDYRVLTTRADITNRILFGMIAYQLVSPELRTELDRATHDLDMQLVHQDWMSYLANNMINPLRTRLDYAGIAQRLFTVQALPPLPEGAIQTFYPVVIPDE